MEKIKKIKELFDKAITYLTNIYDDTSGFRLEEVDSGNSTPIIVVSFLIPRGLTPLTEMYFQGLSKKAGTKPRERVFKKIIFE